MLNILHRGYDPRAGAETDRVAWLAKILACGAAIATGAYFVLLYAFARH